MNLLDRFENAVGYGWASFIRGAILGVCIMGLLWINMYVRRSIQKELVC